MSVPRLGLIGGLGPAATVFYYDQILKGHAERHRAPRLLMSHADKHVVLRAVSRSELTKLAHYLARLANDLKKAGAELVAVAAITPHVCAPQLSDLLRIPFVDAAESIGDALHDRKLKRVAIFGTKLTMESDLFGRLADVAIVRPTATEIQRIRSIYTRLESQRPAPDDVDELGRIAHRLCTDDGADAVVLAGTAFSLISPALRSDVPFIDCGRLHVDAIMSALQIK